VSRALSCVDDQSLLAEASRYLFANILLVREADLSAPTPCRDWDLRHLLHHLCTSLADVADVLAPQSLSRRSRLDIDPTTGTDPVAALRHGIVEFLLASMSSPAGSWCAVRDRCLPAKVVVRVGAIEMVLHSWDIAQACRTESAIPADLASALLRVATPLAHAGAAAHVFAEPQPAPITATPSEQLLALFGRQQVGPGWRGP